METQTGTVGIAWRLLAPSDSGGKIYTIAVIGSDLVVAWGRASAAGPGLSTAGSQAKVEHFPSHVRALAAAMERTQAKQDRGYDIDMAPRQLDVTGKPVAKNTVSLILYHGTVV